MMPLALLSMCVCSSDKPWWWLLAIITGQLSAPCLSACSFEAIHTCLQTVALVMAGEPYHCMYAADRSTHIGGHMHIVTCRI